MDAQKEGERGSRGDEDTILDGIKRGHTNSPFRVLAMSARILEYIYHQVACVLHLQRLIVDALLLREPHMQGFTEPAKASAGGNEESAHTA